MKIHLHTHPPPVCAGLKQFSSLLLDRMDFPDATPFYTTTQQKEVSRLKSIRDTLKDRLDREIQVYESTPLTYVKTRAKKSLLYHERELENLENMFRLKKQEHLDAIKAAQELLEAKPPALARLQVEYEAACKKVKEKTTELNKQYFVSTEMTQHQQSTLTRFDKQQTEDEIRLENQKRIQENKRKADEFNRRLEEQRQQDKLPLPPAEEEEEQEDDWDIDSEDEREARRKEAERKEQDRLIREARAALPPAAKPPKPKKEPRMVKKFGTITTYQRPPIDE